MCGVFKKSHLRVCYTHIYYFNIDIQETFVSITGNYMEKQRVCPLLLFFLDVCVEVINTSVTHPKCHLFKP